MTEQNYQNAINNAASLSYSDYNSTANQKLNAWADNVMLGTVDYERELAQMQMQNSFNAWQSNLAWERQKENAQSQYQWAVEDMRKAGLNPYLAYSNGGNQVGSVPTASNSGFSSQNKSRQTSSLIGGILTSLLGGAFKVATTSMMNESMMAQTLQRIQSSKDISNSINQNRLDIERLRKQNQSQYYFASGGRNYSDSEVRAMFDALKDD